MKRHKKRQPKLYQWQKLRQDCPDYEKEYVQTLTEGLECSADIWQLISGLTVWLGRVAQLERERQQTRIVLPGDIDPKALRLVH